MILEIKKSKDGQHNYVEEKENMIIGNANGSRKFMLFANSKESIYAFTIKPEDLILIKDNETFLFFRCCNIENNQIYLSLIESYVDLKKMPFEYREMALALLQKEKNPKKACYFVGKRNNNSESIAEKMIKKLISYKSATKERKMQLVQEMFADLSAL